MVNPETYTAVNLPEKPNQPDPEKMKEWENSFEDERAKTLAAFLAENVNYVSFEQFTGALMESTKDFMKQVEDRPYVVLVPRDHKENVHKSEVWVTNLAQMVTNNAPQAYVTEKELRDYLREHPEVKDIALFDDASYTGERIGNSINTHKYASKINGTLNMHIVVPFMAKRALQNLVQNEGLPGTPGFKLLIHTSQTIPNVDELIQETFAEESLPEVKECLKKFFNLDVDYENENGFCPTLTYFEHKVPDSISFVESIRKGEVRNASGEVVNKIQFIPDTIPPYKHG